MMRIKKITFMLGASNKDSPENNQAAPPKQNMTPTNEKTEYWMCCKSLGAERMPALEATACNNMNAPAMVHGKAGVRPSRPTDLSATPPSMIMRASTEQASAKTRGSATETLEMEKRELMRWV